MSIKLKSDDLNQSFVPNTISKKSKVIQLVFSLLCLFRGHRWKIFYIESGRCETREYCTCCTLERNKSVKIHHGKTHAEWKENQGKCQLAYVCMRCKEVLEYGEVKEHKWEDVAIDSCTTIRKCNSCGAERAGSEYQDWETILDRGGGWEEVCKRCGAKGDSGYEPGFEIGETWWS